MPDGTSRFRLGGKRLFHCMGTSTFANHSVMPEIPVALAKWWLPDDVVFVDGLPHTATGKLSKTQLRQTYREYWLPAAGT